jgi:signal transduction histidine kinase
VINCFSLSLVMLAALLIAGTFQLPGFEIIRLATFAVAGLAPLAFLAGLLDARLAKAGVGELLVQLQANPAPDLQELLARALRDPTLTLIYWLPQYGSWADQDGYSAALPGPDSGRQVTLVKQKDEPIAALVYDATLGDEPELVAAVSAAAGIALENGRLQAELRARLQELQGSRSRVVEAEQHERQRLERNLHDGAQQRLVALALELGLLAEQTNRDPATHDRLKRARGEVALSLDELRDVARGIHPAVVSGHGLAVALESLAAGAPLDVRLRTDGLPRLPEHLEVAAYYVVSESLTNTAKHAQASQVSVEAKVADKNLIVEVVDDGIGGADSERGSGLRGLADRVEALNGQLQIWSAAGKGTRVRAELPCG